MGVAGLTPCRDRRKVLYLTSWLSLRPGLVGVDVADFVGVEAETTGLRVEEEARSMERGPTLACLESDGLPRGGAGGVLEMRG